jgi:ureidoglycolate lyase
MNRIPGKVLRPRPFIQEAFAPFGQVIFRPEQMGERLDVGGLENRRPHARPTLRTSMSKAAIALPIIVDSMERHAFSSQSFVPLDVSRYLIVVAPHGGDGGPDLTRALAFIAPGDQGVHYNADTWHYQMSPLDRPAKFAVLMWRDDTEGDIETVALAEPIRIEAGEA